MEFFLYAAAIIGIGLVSFLVVRSSQKAMEGYNSFPTFEEYKIKKNGDLMRRGRVTCENCGGDQIYLRRAGQIGTRPLNVHVCRQCGTILYRSGG